MKLRALARILARNWGLKLSALGLAVFLWALVQVDGAGLRTLDVPVAVQLNQSGWMLVGDPTPAFVSVRFSGPTREVVRLGFDGTGLTIPIGRVAGNDTVVVLQPGWIPIQDFPGVQVEDIVPSTVRLRLEQQETRIMPVRISTRGEIPSDYGLTRPVSLNPDVVRITGPESLISALDSLDIVPADLGAVTLEGVLPVELDIAGYGDLTAVPERLTLRVPVEESMRRVLPGVPVDADDAFEGSVELDPSTIEVVLEGARTRVSSVSPGALRLIVPLDALQGLGPTEQRRVPVAVEGLPSFVRARLQTDSVLVRRSDR